jgi:hypothetical protein
LYGFDGVTPWGASCGEGAEGGQKANVGAYVSLSAT